MNIELYGKAFKGLKDFIRENSEISVQVLKKAQGDIFPRVIFTELSNNAISVQEHTSLIGFQADIFAEDITHENQFIDSMEVARYIQLIIAKYFESMHFERIKCGTAPILESSRYRIVMQYVAQASDNRGHFF